MDLELLTLANATRGAEILADYLTRQGFLDDPTEKDAPLCVFSILSLVGGRLDQLRRVVRGEEDPTHIWAAHDASTLTESLADIDGDIVLFSWKARGMPLVLARPSAWGVEPEEREERRGIEQESGKAQLRSSKSRKAKEPKPLKEPRAAVQAPKAPIVPGGEPEQSPPTIP